MRAGDSVSPGSLLGVGERSLSSNWRYNDPEGWSGAAAAAAGGGRARGPEGPSQEPPLHVNSAYTGARSRASFPC